MNKVHGVSLGILNRIQFELWHAGRDRDYDEFKCPKVHVVLFPPNRLEDCIILLSILRVYNNIAWCFLFLLNDRLWLAYLVNKPMSFGWFEDWSRSIRSNFDQWLCTYAYSYTTRFVNGFVSSLAVLHTSFRPYNRKHWLCCFRTGELRETEQRKTGRNVRYI